MAVMRKQIIQNGNGREQQGSSTRSVHGGAERQKAHNSLTTPIVQTATYTFRDTQELIDYMESKTWGDGAERG